MFGRKNKDYTVSEGDVVKFSNGVEAGIKSISEDGDGESWASVIWKNSFGAGNRSCELLDDTEDWFDDNDPEATLIEGGLKL